MIFQRPPRQPLTTNHAVFRPVGAAQALPLIFDPRVNYGARPLPPPEDQGPVNDCQEFTHDFCFWNAVGFKGRPPSRRALYWMAQARERRYVNQLLVDEGTNDFDLLASITLTGDPKNDETVWGLVPMDVWPDDNLQPLEELPPDVVQAAVPIQPGDVEIIVATGADLVAAIQRAVAGAGPSLQWGVPFTMAVDDAYESLGAQDVYRGARGPSRGLHKQALCGYAPDPGAADGLPKLLVRGSWGRGFADGGYAWIAGSVIVSGQCSGYEVVKGGIIL